jgi:hypothetical protein
MPTSVAHWAVMSRSTSPKARDGVQQAKKGDEQAFVVPAHAQTNHLPLAAILLLVE